MNVSLSVAFLAGAAIEGFVACLFEQVKLDVSSMKEAALFYTLSEKKHSTTFAMQFCFPSCFFELIPAKVLRLQYDCEVVTSSLSMMPFSFMVYPIHSLFILSAPSLKQDSALPPAPLALAIWTLPCSTLDELQPTYKSRVGSTQAVLSLIVAMSSLS